LFNFSEVYWKWKFLITRIVFPPWCLYGFDIFEGNQMAYPAGAFLLDYYIYTQKKNRP